MPSIDTNTDAANNDSFDVVSHYTSLLAKDADLTMPVAAIESLVAALARSNATTISETLSVLTSASDKLKASIPNPISLSAGTDLFTRYLVSSLRNTSSADADFHATRTHLLSNGRLFVERAKAAREQIAGFARHFIREGSTILTNGGSRVVGAALRAAAESSSSSGSVRFRVIYVVPSAPSKQAPHVAQETEGAYTVATLRKLGVPVATVSEAAIGYAMAKVDMVIVGAEGVVENGGIISRLGTYQIGMLAKGMGKPFYVVAESHKFVRLFPLGQYDLGIEQSVIDFQTEAGGKLVSEGTENGPSRGEGKKISDSSDAVDYTPPNLISGIITESGVHTPSAVSEELIGIWL